MARHRHPHTDNGPFGARCLHSCSPESGPCLAGLYPAACTAISTVARSPIPGRWSDRQGKVPWTADTGAMVFSATKGPAGNGDSPFGRSRPFWSYDAGSRSTGPEFEPIGKSEVTVSDVLRHRSDCAPLDEVMKQKLAAVLR